jgi:NTE family protein
VTERDVLITPQLGNFSSSNFREAATLIPLGERAAREKAEQLRKLALSPEAYQALRAAQMQHARRQAPAQEVRLDTTSLGFVNPAVTAAQVRTGPVQGVDRADLTDAIDTLLASDDFEQVRYRFVDVDGQRALVLEPVAKSWGPSYLRFGLSLSSDFQGNSAFDVVVDHRATWLNQRGLEWRNTLSIGQVDALRSELYQPIDLARRFFVAPSVQWRQEVGDLFVDNDALARYRDRKLSAGLDLGANVSRTTELRVGYEWAQVWSSLLIGFPFLPDVREEYGAVKAQLRVDSLDDWGFPTHGMYANLQLETASESLGGSLDFDRAEVTLDVPLRLSARHRLLAGLRWGDSFGTSLPLSELFELGGFLNLSGYQPRQILAEGFTFGRLIYYYRLGAPGAYTDNLYFGASLEAADVHDRVNSLDDKDGFKLSGAVFFAADTALGPVYLGFGLGEDDNYALYLLVGRP